MPYREPPENPPGEPLYFTLRRNASLFRIHSTRFGANEFNPRRANNPFQGGRFDSAEGDYTYLYAGGRVVGTVAETLLRDVPEGAIGEPRVLLLAQLQRRVLSEIVLQRPLRFVDLTGPGLFALGQTDTWLTKGDASQYPQTRHWAKSIRRWCPDAAGFRWRSRIDDNEFSYVIFGDRVLGDSLVKRGRSARLTSGRGRSLLEPALRPYGFELPT